MHEVLTGNNYVDAIHETMRAGGCTCSRCGFIGACLAARVSFHYVALLLLITSTSSTE
jgi:hypothetical protein